MASLLRSIVAGPRARHPEAGLDLCYVTDDIIATSGPSGTYPQLAYRNPLPQLVKFLDSKHGDDWAIWEFRAEGTGYPDSEVYNRINHYPWPDHHPPPFALIPLIMGSMRNWLSGEPIQGGKLREGVPQNGTKKDRVVVVHCKAGKGRSGTSACSYLISEQGWKAEDALKRFTERRMRPGFGAGVSIPSQLRWVGYVDRWTRHGKKYVERGVEVLELHVWGLRDGVKISIEGFVDEGRTIKSFHTFSKDEREIIRHGVRTASGFADAVVEAVGHKRDKNDIEKMGSTEAALDEPTVQAAVDQTQHQTHRPHRFFQGAGGDIVFRPKDRLKLPTNDINVDFERRNNANYGFALVTAVAHVWFNAFFEGQGPEKDGVPDTSGVFEIDWDAMDGIKGSSRKGTRAFDRIAVLWKSATDDAHTPIHVPAEGEDVKQTRPADWRGNMETSPSRAKDLGIRQEKPDSAAISRASSAASRHGHERGSNAVHNDSTEAVQSYLGEEEGTKGTQDGLLPLSGDLPGPQHHIEGTE